MWTTFALAAALVLATQPEKVVKIKVPLGLDDPTPHLLNLMDRLERRLLWRPRPDLSLPERIYRLAGGLLALRVRLPGQDHAGKQDEQGERAAPDGGEHEALSGMM